MIKNYIFILTCWLLASNLLAQQIKKTVFSNKFPQMCAFRGEYVNAHNGDVNEWFDGNRFSDGVIKKYVNWDELDRIDLNTQQWSDEYVQANPECLMQLHWDMREHRNDQTDNSDRYFPGHWLQLEGSTLTNAIDEFTTEITVANINPFKQKKGAQYKYPTLIIVPTDEEGNRVWYESEFVQIENINVSEKKITIKRGTALSEPKAFQAGVYIAPMSTRLCKTGLFDYNFSTTCPKDKNGKQAADIVIEELTELMLPGGILDHLDGICFDVLQWSPRGSYIDTDNDGIADGGIINGINEFQIGSLALQEKIREALGDDMILTSDGYEKINQRAPQLFNGIESEGLVTHVDAYRGFAKTINVFEFWRKFCTASKQFSYIVPKVKNTIDMEKEEQYKRLCFGTATCLGVAVTRFVDEEASDEQVAGNLNTQNWLGEPIGEMIRIAQQQPDLLGGASFNYKNDLISSNACDISQTGNEIIISGNSANEIDPMSIQLNNVEFGEANEDIVIYFKIKRNNDNNIPSLVHASADNLPDYGEPTKEQSMHNELWSGYTNNDFTLVSLYYREIGGINQNITLTFDQQDDVTIKDLTIHQSSQLIAREFQNGVVLVNPAHSEQEFDLTSLFGNKIYNKIEGINDPIYNDGEEVQGTVTVGDRNALFLIGDHTQTSVNENMINKPRIICNNENSTVFMANVNAPYSMNIYNLHGQLVEKHINIAPEKKVRLSERTSGILLVKGTYKKESYSLKIFKSHI